MALESIQPLTEKITKKFPGGKRGRCVRLTNLPPPCAVVMKSGNLNFLEPSGPLQDCNGTGLPWSEAARGVGVILTLTWSGGGLLLLLGI